MNQRLNPLDHTDGLLFLFLLLVNWGIMIDLGGQHFGMLMDYIMVIFVPICMMEDQIMC